jgi:hypothetical protein
MIVLLCCFEFHMIVLKAEQAAIMQRWKDEEREAKERMLVSDFFFFFVGSKDLCCSECHMIVLLCCYEFHMIVLKAEQAARMQRWKDEEREAKEHMLVSDFFFFFLIFWIKRSLLL